MSVRSQREKSGNLIVIEANAKWLVVPLAARIELFNRQPKAYATTSADVRLRLTVKRRTSQSSSSEVEIGSAAWRNLERMLRRA